MLLRLFEIDFNPPAQGEKLCGNQMYLLAAILAHNFSRELQMQDFEQNRSTTEKCAPLWIFQKLDTIRRNLIQRAGRITRPNGKLKLTIDASVLS